MLVRFFCAPCDATVVDLPCWHWIDGREERNTPASLLFPLPPLFFFSFSFLFCCCFCSPLSLPPFSPFPMHTLLALQISLGGLPAFSSSGELDQCTGWDGRGHPLKCWQWDDGAAQESCCCALHHACSQGDSCRSAAGAKRTKGCLSLFIKGEGGGWQRFFEAGHLSGVCFCALPKGKVACS